MIKQNKTKKKVAFRKLKLITEDIKTNDKEVNLMNKFTELHSIYQTSDLTETSVVDSLHKKVLTTTTITQSIQRSKNFSSEIQNPSEKIGHGNFAKLVYSL